MYLQSINSIPIIESQALYLGGTCGIDFSKNSWELVGLEPTWETYIYSWSF